MFGFFKKDVRENKFDRKVLWKNDISLLILDERWNSLFKNTEKTPEILKCEEEIRELLKEQARVIAESKELARRKKECMESILSLTTEAFENNNEHARKNMQEYEKEIKNINQRLPQVQDELDSIPGRIKQANLELLDYAVNHVYLKMRESKRRVEELELLIAETRDRLKQYIDEKESLSEEDTEVYSYFHDLLGGEELEKLDREHFDGGK